MTNKYFKTKESKGMTIIRMAGIAGACSLAIIAGVAIMNPKEKSHVKAEETPVVSYSSSDELNDARNETAQLQRMASEKRHADEAEKKAQAEAEAAAKAKRLAEYEARIRAEEEAKKAEAEKAQAAEEKKIAEDNQKAQEAVKQDTAKRTSGVRYSWTSHGSTQADVDAGNMVNTYGSYFAADIRTRMGKQIKSLVRGDVVSINGRMVVIDGSVFANYNDKDAYEHINASIRAKGYDADTAVCFQTCIPPYGGPVVVMFGHYVS